MYYVVVIFDGFIVGLDGEFDVFFVEGDYMEGINVCFVDIFLIVVVEVFGID